MAGLFFGHIPEYPEIRIDHFSSPKSPIPIPPYLVKDVGRTHFPAASLYLLTHCHTDHTQGLQTVQGGLKIICSHDTKTIILNMETADARYRKNKKLIGKRELTYIGLQTGCDCLDPYPYNTPTAIPISHTTTIVLTLLSANHCPGSSMFLIQGPNGAVLHTGDIRCEPSFIEAIVKEKGCPLERFGGWRKGESDEEGRARMGEEKERLKAIYLDTSSLLGTGDMPEKKDGVQDVINLMKRYPSNTRFFLNAWTWGYEELLLGVAQAWPEEKIHLDRYKRAIYRKIPSISPEYIPPSLDNLPGEPLPRFHACEMRDRCKLVWKTGQQEDGSLVVTVNPIELRLSHWELYIDWMEGQLQAADAGRGEWPCSINAPIARHSSLPELQSLVSLFRPNTIYPNSVLTKARPIELLSLPILFHSHLPPSGSLHLQRFISSWCEQVEPDGGEAAMWDRIVAMMAPSSTTTGGGVGGVEGQVGLVVGTPEKDREKREEFSAEGGWGGVAGTRPEFFADGEEALKAEESLLRSLVGNEGKGKGKGKEERVMAVGTETRAYGTKSNRVLGQLLAVINGGQEDDAIRKVLECEEMVDVGEQLVGAGAKTEEDAYIALLPAQQAVLDAGSDSILPHLLYKDQPRQLPYHFVSTDPDADLQRALALSLLPTAQQQYTGVSQSQTPGAGPSRCPRSSPPPPPSRPARKEDARERTGREEERAAKRPKRSTTPAISPPTDHPALPPLRLDSSRSASTNSDFKLSPSLTVPPPFPTPSAVPIPHHTAALSTSSPKAEPKPKPDCPIDPSHTSFDTSAFSSTTRSSNSSSRRLSAPLPDPNDLTKEEARRSRKAFLQGPVAAQIREKKAREKQLALLKSREGGGGGGMDDNGKEVGTGGSSVEEVGKIVVSGLSEGGGERVGEESQEV